MGASPASSASHERAVEQQQASAVGLSDLPEEAIVKIVRCVGVYVSGSP